MIKAVIFDLGGVLINNADTWNIYCAKTLHVPINDFIAVRHDYEKERQLGKMSDDVFWQKVKEKLHVQIAIDPNLWLESFQAGYKRKDDVFAVVDKLRTEKIKTALLSNTEESVMAFIKKQHFSDFDEFIFSCELGIEKPQRGIYEYALQKLHVNPEEAVMVDDVLENVEKAKVIGMYGIHYIDTPSLIENMQKLGITL